MRLWRGRRASSWGAYSTWVAKAIRHVRFRNRCSCFWVCVLTSLGPAASCDRVETGDQRLVSFEGSEYLEKNEAGSKVMPWREGEEWFLADPPILELRQALDSPFSPPFFDVKAAIRFRDGRLVIADGGNQELMFFDNHGNLERKEGGVGDGPGEFRGLTWIGMCAGDSVYAYDYVKSRISVFDETGGFARSFVLRTRGLAGTPYSLSCNRKGAFLVRGWPIIQGKLPVGPLRPLVSFSLTGLEGEEVQYLGEYPGDEMYAWPTQVGPRPLGQVTVEALGRDRVFLGAGTNFEIGILSLDGAPLGRIRVPIHDSRLTGAEVREFIRERGKEVGDQDRRRALTRMLEAVEYPDSAPAYEKAIVDESGNLWVRAFTRKEDGTRIWWVFDSVGIRLGKVESPLGLTVYQIGDDLVLGRWVDSFGVESVRAYRLVKEPNR